MFARRVDNECHLWRMVSAAPGCRTFGLGRLIVVPALAVRRLDGGEQVFRFHEIVRQERAPQFFQTLPEVFGRWIGFRVHLSRADKAPDLNLAGKQAPMLDITRASFLLPLRTAVMAFNVFFFALSGARNHRSTQLPEIEIALLALSYPTG
jgi:hypothetical protein